MLSSLAINTDDIIGKSTSKSIRIYPVFYLFFKLNLVKKGLFLVKKGEIQFIIFMVTRSSGRIFNPSHCTGLTRLTDRFLRVYSILLKNIGSQT